MVGQSNLMPGQLPGYARVWLRLCSIATVSLSMAPFCLYAHAFRYLFQPSYIIIHSFSMQPPSYRYSYILVVVTYNIIYTLRGVSNAAKSRTRLRNLCNFTKITPGLHPDYTGITHVCNSYLTHICNLICICNSYL